MKRWGFLHLYIERLADDDGLELLAEWGEEGWELVAVTVDDEGVHHFFLKRDKDDER